MDALVIYYQGDSRAAALWCADQGALAVLRLREGDSRRLEVGDLISVTLEETPSLRLCTSWNMLRPAALPAVGQMLKSEAQKISRAEPVRQFPSLVAFD